MLAAIRRRFKRAARGLGQSRAGIAMTTAAIVRFAKANADRDFATPAHPISRGLSAFPLREEYYYNLRFRAGDPRLVPILATPIPGESAEQVVAFAVERNGGGRGFGFSGGHFFENWGASEFRRMVLNAILWTAHAEVPPGGVDSTPPAPSDPPIAPDDKPISAVIVTGHQHPAHNWRETTVALDHQMMARRRDSISLARGKNSAGAAAPASMLRTTRLRFASPVTTLSTRADVT